MRAYPYLTWLGILALCFLAAPGPGQVSALTNSSPTTPVTEAIARNPSDPTRSDIDLSTPRASLRNFIDSARQGNFEKAALSLDLSNLPEEKRQEGELLAWKLKVVLDQFVWVDWAEIPDQTDGTLSTEEESRPSGRVRVGEIPFRGKQVPVRLEKGENGNWLVSSSVVLRIDELYREHGLGWAGEWIPLTLQTNRFLEIALWQWIALLVAAILSWIAGRIIQTIALHIIPHLWPKELDEKWRKRAPKRLRGPIALTTGLLVFHLLFHTSLALAEPAKKDFGPVLFMALVLALAWFAIRFVTFISEAFGGLYSGRLEKQDVYRARTFTTQLRVLRRVVNFLIFILALGAALYQFDVFRTIGTSLLASAGLAGVILGLAAQRSLGNIFAGIQLALSQPVRIGDNVVFEGEWGWIEEITSTYVSIRIWDLRRLVVPVTYLLERPIENWTMTSTELLGTVYIYTDYRVPLNKLREQLTFICENTDLWDGKVQKIQITGCTEETMEVRALCSAADAGKAWDLRCLVREKMIVYLQELEDGRYLPRTRVEMRRDEEPKPPGEKQNPREAARESEPEGMNEQFEKQKNEQEKRERERQREEDKE